MITGANVRFTCPTDAIGKKLFDGMKIYLYRLAAALSTKDPTYNNWTIYLMPSLRTRIATVGIATALPLLSFVAAANPQVDELSARVNAFETCLNSSINTSKQSGQTVSASDIFEQCQNQQTALQQVLPSASYNHYIAQANSYIVKQLAEQ